MGLFDRFKKQEEKPAAPTAPKTGLIDFHPYDTGLAESVRALEKDLRALNTNGRRGCDRDEFIALLAGIASLRMCDRVAVMTGGEIVEAGDVDEIYDHPKHAYTKKLLDASLALD